MNDFDLTFEPGEILTEDYSYTDVDIQQAAHAIKAMGHPLRLQLMCVLAAKGEVSVQDLVNVVGTSQSNISQHLSILRERDILSTRKQANKVFYHISDTKILQLMGLLRDTFCPTKP
ncbi:MAG: metalloregulator ArsR/SmtB family transcription factor [Gammaproteobacteria bacterium]|nr:metalloregulator ArsR/SmtB family transcription factor [Gammaproteobacteria bacterium]